MKTVSLNIPDELSELEAKIILASDLLKRGMVTLDQASNVAGLTKGTFVEMANHFGFPVSEKK